MSQVRQRKVKRQQQTFKLHETRETVEAVVGVGIVVVGTLLLVWLMRPGGLASRQPRASWWVLLSLLAAGGLYYLARHPSIAWVSIHRPRLLTMFIFLMVIAITCAGFFWPGGLLRQTPSAPGIIEPLDGDPIIDPSTDLSSDSTPTVPTDTSPSTGVTNDSTVPEASSSTGATAPSTVPASSSSTTVGG